MTRSHGPPSQPYSASPATNAAAPSSRNQPRTVGPAMAAWSHRPVIVVIAVISIAPIPVVDPTGWSRSDGYTV